MKSIISIAIDNIANAFCYYESYKTMHIFHESLFYFIEVFRKLCTLHMATIYVAFFKVLSIKKR